MDRLFRLPVGPLPGVARLLPVALILCLAGCGGARPLVKIGLVAPFEGRYRPVGYDVIYSARLAVRQANAAAGPFGVALVALDDGGDPGLARATAASLIVDPAVVAVVGHWRPETTAAAAALYEQAGLILVPATGPAFDAGPSAGLPAGFRSAYEAVTPFDETPGPYAGPAYHAFQLVLAALNTAGPAGGPPGREAVSAILRAQLTSGP